MKNKLWIFVIIFSLTIFNRISFPNVGSNPSETYYFYRISNNLEHLINPLDSLYILSQKQNIEKRQLEKELSRLEEGIQMTNTDIAQMIKYISETEITDLQIYLKGLDIHLAQAHIDINSLEKGLNENKQIDIPSLILDIENQLNEAKNVDYLQIERLQNYQDEIK